MLMLSISARSPRHEKPSSAFGRVTLATRSRGAGHRRAPRAWHIGMRRCGHQKLRNDTYCWETELGALNSGYMSYAAVADSVPEYARSRFYSALRLYLVGSHLKVSNHSTRQQADCM